MKKLCAFVLLSALFGIALPAKPQDETSKLEAYGGYDFAGSNANPKISGVPPSESFNANGVSGQIDIGVSRRRAGAWNKARARVVLIPKTIFP